MSSSILKITMLCMRSVSSRWWRKLSKGPRPPALLMARQDPVKLSRWWVQVTALSVACTLLQLMTSSNYCMHTRASSCTYLSTRFIAVSSMTCWIRETKWSAEKTQSKESTLWTSLRSKPLQSSRWWTSSMRAWRGGQVAKRVPTKSLQDHTPSSVFRLSTAARALVRWASLIWQVVRGVPMLWTLAKRPSKMEQKSTRVSSPSKSASELWIRQARTITCHLEGVSWPRCSKIPLWETARQRWLLTSHQHCLAVSLPWTLSDTQIESRNWRKIQLWELQPQPVMN